MARPRKLAAATSRAGGRGRKLAVATSAAFAAAFPGAFTKAAIFPGSSGALGVPLEVFSPANLFSAAEGRPYLGVLLAQGYADGAAWAAPVAVAAAAAASVG